MSANDLPDVLARWQSLIDPRSKEFTRPRTEQSFTVPLQEIVANGFLLSLSGYQEASSEPLITRSPAEIIADIRAVNSEIEKELEAIEGLLG